MTLWSGIENSLVHLSGPALVDFMHQGGPVLWGLALAAGLCWLLVVERVLYLLTVFPAAQKSVVARWQSRQDQASWYAHAVRERWLFDLHCQLFRNLNLIKGLVAICPMLGLLGTVTGMITVFDVMAGAESNDPRAMANGISMATLPTLAGMVIALAGMFAHARLKKLAERRAFSLLRALRGA